MSDELDRHFTAVRTAHAVQAGLDVSEPTDLTKCPCCEQERDDVRKRRRNSAYADDALNWLVCCGECFASDTEAFAELWSAHYGNY